MGGFIAPYGVPINMYTYNWTVSIDGRFVDKRTAKGTLNYEALYGGGRVELHAPAGSALSCGKVSVKFTARRGAPRPIYLDPPQPDEY